MTRRNHCGDVRRVLLRCLQTEAFRGSGCRGTRGLWRGSRGSRGPKGSAGSSDAGARKDLRHRGSWCRLRTWPTQGARVSCPKTARAPSENEPSSVRSILAGDLRSDWRWSRKHPRRSSRSTTQRLRAARKRLNGVANGKAKERPATEHGAPRAARRAPRNGGKPLEQVGNCPRPSRLALA